MKTAIFVDIQNIYYTTRDTFKGSFDYRNFWKKIESEHEILIANAYAIDKGDDKQKKFQFALKSIGFNVKLKPYISRADGSNKGDWDVGITIDILESAQDMEKIILLSGDGDFDLIISKVINSYNCIADVYGVKELSADSLINAASNFFSITRKDLI